MREIKFRAWDKDFEEMLHVAKIEFGNNQELFIECYWENDNDLYLRENNERIVLMQYTGLKDKNGAEIYEGDVLEIKVHDYSTKRCIATEKRVVEYRKCSFGVEWGHRSEFISLCGFSEQNTTFNVVGNVYQNSELLEV